MGDVEKNKRWEEIQRQMEIPVGLTELEKEKLRNIINAVKQMLDESLEAILDMSRSKAYSYTTLIVNAVQEADMKFAGGVQPSQILGLTLPTEQIKTIGPVPELDFDKIYGSLSSTQQQKANRHLDCVKTVFDLKKMLEDPETPEKERKKININTVLCNSPDKTCSAEEMIKCITIADPSVRDEMDEARFSGTHQV